MSDELRKRLRRINPMGPDVETRPVSEAREMMEHVMSTDTNHRESPTRHRNGDRQERSPVLGAAGSTVALPRVLAPLAAGIAAAALAAFSLLGGGPEPLTLSAGDADPALASCLPFSEDILAEMPVAFEGTVTGVDGDTLTLDVVQWYTGGEADEVIITAPLGMEALIGGIPFEEGGAYLITATDGVVNYCGYTAVATPELREVFASAF